MFIDKEIYTDIHQYPTDELRLCITKMFIKCMCTCVCVCVYGKNIVLHLTFLM